VRFQQSQTTYFGISFAQTPLMMLDQLNLKANNELSTASKPTTAGSLPVMVEIQEKSTI
jgi:hypothetical protein